MRHSGVTPARPGSCTSRRLPWTIAAGVLVALLAVLGLVGCSGAGDGSESTTDAGAPVPQDGSVDLDQGDAAKGEEPDAAPGDVLVPEGRAVIATASVLVRVDDVVLTLPRLTGVAAANGGYVAGEDSATDPEDPTRTTAVVVLRVPTEAMPAVLEQVAGFGDVLSRQQDVRDVTEQVVDVDSRVASARASVDRIRLLLDRAESIADIVRIEGELSRREADLESLLAQQRSLRDQTEYATVTVTLVGADTPAPIDDETGFLVGLEKGWHAFTTAVAWSLTVLGAVLPFVLLGLVALVPLLALRRRRSAGTSQPATSEEPDAGGR